MIARLLSGQPRQIDGQTIDPRMQLLSKVAALAPMDTSDTQRDKTLRLNRRGIEAMGVLLGSKPKIADVLEVIVRGKAGIIPAKHYRPAGLPALSGILIYFHGGGFVGGSPESCDSICRHLAVHAGVQVLSVDYRLAPEHPFPAAVEDAHTVYEYVLNRAASFGVDPAQIALGGDSAGGNLTAVVSALATTKPAFALMFYPATDRTRDYPSQASLADGFVLTQDLIDWFVRQYLPDEDDVADPRISPMLATELTDFPPSYLATAGFDPLRDEGEAFGARLAEAGVPVVIRRHPALIHGFANLTRFGLPGRDALIEAAGALRAGLDLQR